MSIAVFKPKNDAAGEGQEVWGKIHQKEVTAAELNQHLADGWTTSAAEALARGQLDETQRQNAALEKQISASQALLAAGAAGTNAKLQADAAVVDSSLLKHVDDARAEGNVTPAQVAAYTASPAVPMPASETDKVDLRTKEGRALKARQDADKGGAQ